MKALYWLSLVSFGGLLAASCSDDGEETDTSTSGAGATSASTSGPVTASTGVSTSSTGGMMNTGVCGSPVAFGNDPTTILNGCLTENCCTSFDPCFADTACQACLADPMGAGCDANPLYMAFSMCLDTSCPVSICASDLAYQSVALNACITENCCTTFTACEMDATCNMCLLDPMTAGCDTNTLFQPYEICRNGTPPDGAGALCPTDICGTTIGFYHTYESNMAQDVVIDSNVCAATNCCTDLTACADPTGDGIQPMNDPEVSVCVDCLNAEATCPGGAVQASAEAFNACMTANCPTP